MKSKITGIQIIGKLHTSLNGVTYIKEPIELTIDTNNLGSWIISYEDLLKFVEQLNNSK